MVSTCRPLHLQPIQKCLLSRNNDGVQHPGQHTARAQNSRSHSDSLLTSWLGSSGEPHTQVFVVSSRRSKQLGRQTQEGPGKGIELTTFLLSGAPANFSWSCFPAGSCRSLLCCLLSPLLSSEPPHRPPLPTSCSLFSSSFHLPVCHTLRDVSAK